MRFSLKIILLFSALFFASTIFSQSASQAIAMGQDVNVLFRNEANGSIFAHSRGFGANYRRLWHVTGTRKRLIEIELLNMRYPKQEKVKKDEGKSYYYGKLNGILFMRAGYGYQNTLYRRAERKSIEVRMAYTVGPTICFAKPVFLQVQYPDPTAPVGSTEYIVKTEAYDPTTQNQDNILGSASIFYGLGQTKIYPGAHAKLGFSFEYGETRSSIKAIEVGAVLDYFPQAVPIMAYVQPENFFLTLYVGFNFGKRWF